jgi:hypothetical protein
LSEGEVKGNWLLSFLIDFRLLLIRLFGIKVVNLVLNFLLGILTAISNLVLVFQSFVCTLPEAFSLGHVSSTRLTLGLILVACVWVRTESITPV